MDNIVPDEWDAHVAACYDSDAPRMALCDWCRYQIALCERAAIEQGRGASPRLRSASLPNQLHRSED